MIKERPLKKSNAFRQLTKTNDIKWEDVEEKVDEIVGYHNAQGQAYSPFRIEFDQALLFVPACLEFMNSNRDLVRKHLPEVHTCQCNAFSVRPHGKPFGFHHASTLGIEFKELYDRGWFFPEFHMSFHTAFNPTNKSTSPLVVFDGEIPKLFNDGYLLGKFLEEKSWRPDLTKLARRAVMEHLCPATLCLGCLLRHGELPERRICFHWNLLGARARGSAVF